MESESSSSDSCKNKPKLEKISLKDLCSYYSYAVVRVNGEFSLTTSAFVAPPAPLPAYNSYFTQGNGFFIRHKDHKKEKRFIICPASLVLIAPNVMGQNNRFPFVSNTDTVPPPNAIRTVNKLTRVAHILVEVFNVNSKGESYVYEAELVGVDGAGNSAVLRICHKTPWNETNPKIKECHPALEWGCVADMCCSDKVYGLGQYYSNVRLITTQYGKSPATMIISAEEGRLLSNHHIDNAGMNQVQLILTNITVYGHNIGMPILDEYARVIGMSVGAVLADTNTPLDSPDKTVSVFSAISQVFLKKVVEVFYCGKESKHGFHIEIVPDNLGSFLKYKKGYLGLAWQISYGVNYDAHLSPSTFVRTIQYDPNTFELLPGPDCKKIIGLEIIAIAGGPGTIASYVPGETAKFDGGGNQIYDLVPNSPLLTILDIGDIITEINGIKLGEQECQYSGSLVTWKKVESDTVCITYKKASENFSEEHVIKVKLLDFPPLMDYPWSIIGTFPHVDLPTPIYTSTPGFPIPEIPFRAAF